MTKEFFVPFNTNRLSLSEFSQCMTTTVTAIKLTRVKLAEAPRVLQAVTKLEQSIPELEPGIKQEKPVTGKELRAADKQRDKDWKHLGMVVDVAKHSRQKAKQEAAEEIDKVLVKYKGVTNENYEKESKHITQAIQRLEKSPLREKINLIGAAEQLANLKESQNTFYQLYMTYTQHRGKNISKKVNAAKADIKKQYEVLYQYLLCEIYWDNNSPLKPLLLAMNDCRLDYAKLIARREAKNAKATVKDNQEQAEHGDKGGDSDKQ